MLTYGSITAVATWAAMNSTDTSVSSSKLTTPVARLAYQSAVLWVIAVMMELLAGLGLLSSITGAVQGRLWRSSELALSPGGPAVGPRAPGLAGCARQPRPCRRPHVRPARPPPWRGRRAGGHEPAPAPSRVPVAVDGAADRRHRQPADRGRGQLPDVPDHQLDRDGGPGQPGPAAGASAAVADVRLHRRIRRTPGSGLGRPAGVAARAGAALGPGGRPVPAVGR